MYMETSPEADNSTFGNVTLKCSFSQITWGNLDVERVGEPSVTLKEIYRKHVHRPGGLSAQAPDRKP